MKVTSGVIFMAALAGCSGFAVDARADALRTSMIGRCSIALTDRDNEINPYDFGRNPAWLLRDFDSSWIRFGANISEESGELKRPFDPGTVSDASISISGRKLLSERHAAFGSFSYSRLKQRDISRSIEISQYNDPFYLTDATKGDFEYYGPLMAVDYGLQLSPRLAIGGGLDYDISTGLKDVYTRPQINHNFLKASFGVAYDVLPWWAVGFVARPVRLQNRTNFEKPDEGYDNIIYRYAGDGIYELRTFSSYTIRETLYGVELALQNFFTTDRIKIGSVATYRMSQTKIKYNDSTPEKVGLWQDTAYDVDVLGRYAFRGLPLVLGVSASSSDVDGWAKRPRYDDVLLYESVMKLRSAGAGLAYDIAPIDATLSCEYVFNAYTVHADDYGAHSYRFADITQNVGRVGVEKRILNIAAIRAGVEAIDYPIDRWLKLPKNMDQWRYSMGGQFNWRLWEMELALAYARSTADDYDGERRDLSGILWFTRQTR